MITLCWLVTAVFAAFTILLWKVGGYILLPATIGITVAGLGALVTTTIAYVISRRSILG